MEIKMYHSKSSSAPHSFCGFYNLTKLYSGFVNTIFLFALHTRRGQETRVASQFRHGRKTFYELCPNGKLYGRQ